MAEKTGKTEKMIFDFDWSGVLEVYMPGLGRWHRVTGQVFRSFNGHRRASYPIETVRGPENVNVPIETYTYTGPVYKYFTNIEVPLTYSGEIEKSHLWEDYDEATKRRLKANGYRA